MVVGKYVGGGIFFVIGIILIKLSFLLGFSFIALGIYFIGKGDKQHQEKDQERRIKMKRLQLEEKELDSKIKHVKKKK